MVEPLLAKVGIEFLNDMSALPDDRNARACAEHQVALLIMHSVGEPKVPHLTQQWDDVMGAMEEFFEENRELIELAKPLL